ncbi:hypothetical protein THAOC_13262 [Thalassiosira oceanica]|uniref:Uncharacterized protein n=1 Tax=Thalassiosira oceanica TaxID=159749 RepID=K0SI31_THAOC|nr:hypothetical protein THAOC_13262 [Thalassiosira oceanica]|eukprot:EJK65838.1 hypothetical protein THAOC_13262 [Thalassiosira oceanica]
MSPFKSGTFAVPTKTGDDDAPLFPREPGTYDPFEHYSNPSNSHSRQELGDGPPHPSAPPQPSADGASRTKADNKPKSAQRRSIVSVEVHPSLFLFDLDDLPPENDLDDQIFEQMMTVGNWDGSPRISRRTDNRQLKSRQPNLFFRGGQ